MTKPISVGDLVAVVRPTPCCGKLGQSYGTVFTVTRIRQRTDSHCAHCDDRGDVQLVDGGPYLAVTLSRLKRIPPLDELEGEKDFAKLVDDMQRKLKEPA